MEADGPRRIDAWGVTLRDIDTGLVDFPALANGRPIWLCWRLGEGEIAWWHELEAGSPAADPSSSWSSHVRRAASHRPRHDRQRQPGRRAAGRAATGALIVDVREPSEYDALRAPGAVLLPLVELAARLGPAARPASSCWSAARAAAACAPPCSSCSRASTTSANVDGGMIAWRNAGLPTHSGPPEPGEGELSRAIGLA